MGYEFTPQQKSEIQSIVANIRKVEGMIGKDAAKKSTKKTLSKLPLKEEQLTEIYKLLGYDK